MTDNAAFQVRPAWALRMFHFVTDEIIDDDWNDDDDPILDEIERAVLDILCRQYGHEIIDDHCGIPAHRYCVFCRRGASSLTPENPPPPAPGGAS